MDQRVVRLRRIFRYLKRGVFLPESVDAFTVGRERELVEVEKRLREVSNGTTRHLFVEGQYGSGKSHFLKAIESIALRERFAVSWVILDGQNHPCNHPTRYLHSLLENLRVVDQPARGLASLVRAWLNSSDQITPIIGWAQQSQSWLKDAILECRSKLDSDQHAPYINALLESRTITHINGRDGFELVSGRLDATAGLFRAAGFNGVVYLFDEVETVATLLWGIRQRYLSYDFLNTLIDGRKHPHCFFVFASTPDFGERVKVDRLNRDLYLNEYPDACRFIQKWHEGSIDIRRLKTITRNYVVGLCKLLRAYHGEAFSWRSELKITDLYIDRFSTEAERLNLQLRQTIRSFIYLLDLCEQHQLLDIEVASSWMRK